MAATVEKDDDAIKLLIHYFNSFLNSCMSGHGKKEKKKMWVNIN